MIPVLPPRTETPAVNSIALAMKPAAKSGIEAQIVLTWAQPIVAIDFYPATPVTNHQPEA